MASQRIEKIKKVILTKPYIFYFIIGFLVYFIANIFINQLYVTGPGILFLSYNLSFVIPFIILTFFVAFLVALNINLIIFKYKEIKALNKVTSFTALGMFMGILGGACPGCFVGLFPAFLGIFGITATLGNLPFFGLEIQLVSAILLIFSAFVLTRASVCKIKVE